MSNFNDPPPPYTAEAAPGVHKGPAPSYIAASPSLQRFCTISPPQTSQPTGYGATATTVVVTQPEVLIIGACPACRVGVLQDDFTCLGILCAILFFPIGLLCCLALREKRCTNCGVAFG